MKIVDGYIELPRLRTANNKAQGEQGKTVSLSAPVFEERNAAGSFRNLTVEQIHSEMVQLSTRTANIQVAIV